MAERLSRKASKAHPTPELILALDEAFLKGQIISQKNIYIYENYAKHRAALLLLYLLVQKEKLQKYLTEKGT